MVRPPIRLSSHGYRGSNIAKLREVEEYNSDAMRIEDYLNREVVPRRQNRIMYSDIARHLKLPVERVRELLYDLDGGDNGLTITYVD